MVDYATRRCTDTAKYHGCVGDQAVISDSAPYMMNQANQGFTYPGFCRHEIEIAVFLFLQS